VPGTGAHAVLEMRDQFFALLLVGVYSVLCHVIDTFACCRDIDQSKNANKIF
jgi:hypothetical protein